MHFVFTLAFLCNISPVYILRIFLNLILVCTAQYAESDLFPIIRFEAIKTILVVVLHFAVSKHDSLDVGGQINILIHTIFLIPTTTLPAAAAAILWEGENWEVGMRRKIGRLVTRYCLICRIRLDFHHMS